MAISNCRQIYNTRVNWIGFLLLMNKFKFADYLRVIRATGTGCNTCIYATNYEPLYSSLFSTRVFNSFPVITVIALLNMIQVIRERSDCAHGVQRVTVRMVLWPYFNLTGDELSWTPAGDVWFFLIYRHEWYSSQGESYSIGIDRETDSDDATTTITASWMTTTSSQLILLLLLVFIAHSSSPSVWYHLQYSIFNIMIL